MGKKKVYVETSVISNLTARPASNIADAARQLSTHAWWEAEACRYELYSSPVVRREASKGDPVAAKKRIDALSGVPELAFSEQAAALAERLIADGAVPAGSPDDALHIAIAAVNGMDYLLSWNFKHITNAQKIPDIRRACAASGVQCPEICTPQMLQEGESA